MFYIFLIVLLFIASVLAHVCYCRQARKPGLQAKAFIFISFIALVVYIILVRTPLMTSGLDPSSWWGLPFRITAGIIFILLAPIYLCFYVLTQLTSPSKKILLAISQRGQLSYGDIVASVRKEDFIMTRLNDLCASGCVKQIDGRYVLTSEGQKIAATLSFMQLILGRNTGG